MAQQVHLLVRSPFGGYAEGDRITDPAEIKAVLAGENSLHVLRTPTPDDDPTSDTSKRASRGPKE